MGNNESTDITIFRQICEVNDLNPEMIMEEVEARFAEKAAGDTKAELLIRTAFEHKANQLLESVIQEHIAEDGSYTQRSEYKIDADPVAPSFLINEDYIRSSYGDAEAERIIEVLGQVKLPIRA
ncbi:hypothetical protein [Pontibacter sp. SGAir0037]|uniref:hypothetical protein n=1 Tax=Pontibacter sp. SGAir0037 TaxID=2571030 RepID=UPI0010CCEA85|nr:hypothetical protein [Pontibacter sp. SGAir0037]QCR22678.1 hypothetical protein C1N53_10205 [Pontibacter sp. SGAir0037]